MITLGEGLHYDVPMEIYRGNCCPGPSVSGSVLEEMRDGEGCPAKALARHYLSPWPRDDRDTPAKAFGRAAHAYLMEGEEVFFERYAVEPEGQDGRTKEGKAWLAANVDRARISFKDFETIKGMKIGLDMNAGTAAAFTEGRPEVTAIWKDTETGIWLKSRPDWLRKGLTINYKTAECAAYEPFMRQAWNLGYFVSAGICVDVMRALGEPGHHCFIAQEKTVPYLAKAWVLTDDYLQGARMVYRKALRQFADCISTGRWEGYGDDVGALPYPIWAERKLADIQSPL